MKKLFFAAVAATALIAAAFTATPASAGNYATSKGGPAPSPALYCTNGTVIQCYGSPQIGTRNDGSQYVSTTRYNGPQTYGLNGGASVTYFPGGRTTINYGANNGSVTSYTPPRIFYGARR